MNRLSPFLLAPLGWLLALPADAQATPPATPIQITATQGIEWKQADNEAIATGNAQAIRGAVTIDADQLIAHYRKKSGIPTATPATASSDPESELNAGDTEIYELEALGHVHIFTKTDNAYGDHAVYSMDSSVLVLTGDDLKLTTPTDIITAKNSIEYYSGQHMAVARGDALIAANDGRSMAADTITGYLSPAASAPAPVAGASPDMLGESGKLQKVDAVGHVTLHTPQQTATGDTGVYLPQQGLARLGGNVHVISGVNVLSGSDAVVNTKSSTATMLSGPGGQVAGTVTPQNTPPSTPAVVGKIHKIKLLVPPPAPAREQIASGDTGLYQPQKGLPGLGGNIHIDSNPNTLTGAGPLADKKIAPAMLQPAAVQVTPPAAMVAAATPPPPAPVQAPAPAPAPVMAPVSQLPPDSPLSLER
jgi:lipopolysaccharide export system protein LptA